MGNSCWVNESEVPSLLFFNHQHVVQQHQTFPTAAWEQLEGTVIVFFSFPIYIFIRPRLLCCSSWTVKIPSRLRLDLQGRNLGAIYLFIYTLFV